MSRNRLFVQVVATGVAVLAGAAGLGVLAYRAGLSEEREYAMKQVMYYKETQLDLVDQARAAETRGNAHGAILLRAQADEYAAKASAARLRVQEIDGRGFWRRASSGQVEAAN